MKVFLEQCIERYQKAAPDHPLETVHTPFIDEDVGVVNPIKDRATRTRPRVPSLY